MGNATKRPKKNTAGSHGVARRAASIGACFGALGSGGRTTSPRRAAPGRECCAPHSYELAGADSRLRADQGSRAPDMPQAAVEHTGPARVRPFRRGSAATGGAGFARPAWPGNSDPSSLRVSCCHVTQAEVVAAINASGLLAVVRTVSRIVVVQVPRLVGAAFNVDFCNHSPMRRASASCPEGGAPGKALAEYLTIASASMTSKQTVCLAEVEPVVPRARGMACAGDGEGSEKRECANRPRYSLRSHGSSLLHVAVGMTGKPSEPPYSGTICGANQP